VSLTSKVNAANKLVERGNECAAANVMEAFINEVKAASNTNRIPIPMADILISQATIIISQLDSGVCPLDPDSDGDSLSDSAEVTLETDPGNQDSEGDSLNDGLEVLGLDTDPLSTDTDDNGTPDTDEDPDADGCTTVAEVGPDETEGGRRSPVDSYDRYDVGGPTQSAPDGVIDLANDILGVIQHYSPLGEPPYDVRFDRGPTIGANHWERAGSDGVIDLPNDILGVIQQFAHNCV